ncbi:MAG TPA: efflux RND transporter periplasmic adaptor subunit [Planctomycetota bacterium]|nr:efflux RND transporter periplasmic adaptor subunit [Planctomycetota bacterium]
MHPLHLSWSCAIAGLLAGCHRVPAAEAVDAAQAYGEDVVLPPSSPQLGSLAVEAAEECDNPPLHLNGRLVWDDGVTVRVFTPFAGRVAKIAADLGETVYCGQSLATITSPDFGQAQANARKATTDLQQAERTVARMRELSAHGAVPQKDLQAAEADLLRAQSERQRTAMQLANYGGSSDMIDQAFLLRAPIGGVLVEKNINPGQEVRADQMLANVPQLAAPLFLISDPQRLWVQIDASETDLPQLAPGQTLQVHTRAYPGESFAGELEVIADCVDPVTHMVRVRGRVDNQSRLLKAEMFVLVDLANHGARSIHVASRAVFLKGERHYLFVEQLPGRFRRQEVRVGREQQGKVVVVDGLRPGDRVVTNGCLLLEQVFQAKG